MQFLKGPLVQKNCHTSITYRSYKDFDQQAFLEDLQQCPWHQLDNLDDVNETLDKWYELFHNVMNKHLPLKSKRVKKKLNSLTG